MEPDWMYFGRVLYESEIRVWPVGKDPSWEALADDERGYYAAMAKDVITAFVAQR